MCFVFIWEQTATCGTYSINWLVFITEMKSVYSAVRTGPLNKAVCTSSLGVKSTLSWLILLWVTTTDRIIKVFRRFGVTSCLHDGNKTCCESLKPIKYFFVCHYLGSIKYVILRNPKWSNILILQTAKTTSLFSFSSKWQATKLFLHPYSLWSSSSDPFKYSISVGFSQFRLFYNIGCLFFLGI